MMTNWFFLLQQRLLISIAVTVLLALAHHVHANPLAINKLGIIVSEQQKLVGDKQVGQYWVQLGALSNLNGVNAMQQQYSALKIYYHQDAKGILRVLAGPYASYKQANELRLKIGKRKAFIRFTQLPKTSAKSEVFNDKQLQKFISDKKTICSDTVKTMNKGISSAGKKSENCPCCLHIRNNQIIDYSE